MNRDIYGYEGPSRVAHEGHLYYKDVLKERYDLDDTIDHNERLRVIISGGSMAGLFTAHALQLIGHDPVVFERSDSSLEERGAGIIAHPEMFSFLEKYDMVDREDIATSTDTVEWLGQNGDVLHEEEMEILTTSWGVVYRNLRKELSDDQYHMNQQVTGLNQKEDGVSVEFPDGATEEGDLMVIAEGYRSTTRQQLLPDSTPTYAGYFAWRGTVPEATLPQDRAERFGHIYTLFHGPNTQFLAYPVPGPNGEVTIGERDINYVWYYPVAETDLEWFLTTKSGTKREHSLPPGSMREEMKQYQNQLADEKLPASLAELVHMTDEPFIQNIYDLSVPQMVFGRTCILGDAAFFARPHTGSGTAKAADDGLRLGEELLANEDLNRALSKWESSQLKLGKRLVELGRDRGDRYTDQR